MLILRRNINTLSFFFSPLCDFPSLTFPSQRSRFLPYCNCSCPESRLSTSIPKQNLVFQPPASSPRYLSTHQNQLRTQDSTFQHNIFFRVRSLFVAICILLKLLQVLICGTKQIKVISTASTANAESFASHRRQKVSWACQHTRGCFGKGTFKCTFGQLHE